MAQRTYNDSGRKKRKCSYQHILEIKNDGRTGDYGGQVTGPPCTIPIVGKVIEKKLHISVKNGQYSKKQFTDAKYNYLKVFFSGNMDFNSPGGQPDGQRTCTNAMSS